MLIIRDEVVVRPKVAFAVVLVIGAILVGAVLFLSGIPWCHRAALGVVIVVTLFICLKWLGDRNDDAGTGPGLPMQQQPAPDHGLDASAIAGLGPGLPMQQQPGPDQGLGASAIAGLGPGLPMQQLPAPNHGLGASAIAGLPTYAYEKACGGGDECAVCLGEVQRGEVVKQLPACMHLFHEGCIDAWLRSHVTCPVCRFPVDAAQPAATEVVV